MSSLSPAPPHGSLQALHQPRSLGAGAASKTPGAEGGAFREPRIQEPFQARSSTAEAEGGFLLESAITASGDRQIPAPQV